MGDRSAAGAPRSAGPEGGTRRVRKAVLRLLDAIGVGQPLRRVARAPSAHGWTRWTPLVPEDAFLAACRDAIQALRRHGPDEDIGDYLEFGVSRGTSLACMHRALDRAGLRRVRLFGFDSFEGLPPEAAAEGWRPGEFSSAEGATRRYLDRAGVDWGRVALVKGWFRDTLTGETRERLGLRKASLVMVDCDIHSAARECLRFCGPLIRDRAVVFFDDWGNGPDGEGEERAFREFLAEFPHLSAEPLPAYIPAARVFLVTRRAAEPPA